MKTILSLFIVAVSLVRIGFTALGQVPPTLSIRLPEGEIAAEKFGGSQVVLEIVRAGDPLPAVSADLKLTPGGGPPGSQAARPGVDFEAVDQRIEIASGETSRRVTLKIFDDGELEGNEFFTAALKNPSLGFFPDEASIVVGVADNELTATLDTSRDPSSRPFVVISRLPNGLYPFFLSMPDGKKLVVGGFDAINGVARPGLARLDTNEELDASFIPANDFRSVVDIPTNPLERILLLRSGAILWFTPSGGLTRMKGDGAWDLSFRSPFLTGFQQVAEGSSDSLWCIQSNTVVHLAVDGSLMSSQPLPQVLNGKGIVTIQSDGGLLAAETLWFPDGQSWEDVLKRWRLDGAADLSFRPIPLARGDGNSSAPSEVSVLPDSRLLVVNSPNSDDHLAIRIFSESGIPDPSYEPPVSLVSGCNKGGTFIGYSDGRLIISSICEEMLGFPELRTTYYLLLNKVPHTSLLVTIGQSVLPVGAHAFSVVFRRLGPSTEPANFHFSTRDVTAIAGKDYVAQSGTLAFAPLEVEKTVLISTIAGYEGEFDKALEVVVSAVEGIEALPAPLRLTIAGQFDLSPRYPRLERIKRLRDGSAISSTSGSSETKFEYTTDLKTWLPLTNLLGDGFFGSGLWLDASATNSTTRFYRAVMR